MSSEGLSDAVTLLRENIVSRTGNAIATPLLRRNDRRSIEFAMMVEPGVSRVRLDAPCEIEELLWLPECLTLCDLVKERSETVLLIFDLRNNLFHGLPV